MRPIFKHKSEGVSEPYVFYIDDKVSTSGNVNQSYQRDERLVDAQAISEKDRHEMSEAEDHRTTTTRKKNQTDRQIRKNSA